MFEFKANIPKAPLYNEPTLQPLRYLQTHPTKYADMDYWLERTPEMVGLLNVMTVDVIGDGFHFEGGRNQTKRAEAFARKGNFKEELSKSVYDWHFYGDGYLTNLKPTASQIDEAAQETVKKLGQEYKSIMLQVKAAIGDGGRLVKHVAASTMNIDPSVDKKSILDYRQVIQGTTVNLWQPEEVIHAKFMHTKGKLYGFSPAQAMIVEMQTLGYIKDYAGTFFSKGGYPDKIFNFKKDAPESLHVRRAKQELQKYNHPTEKHGNLVMTGELEVMDLNPMTKDMEFRQLAVYITGVMAMAYGVPMSRVASIIGSSVKVSTGSDDLANESYWHSVANKQDHWETILNEQLFEDMGVEFKFNRGYKMNEVRETMILLQKLDSLQKMQQLGMIPKKTIVQKLFPDFTEDDFEEIDFKKAAEKQQGSFGARQGYQSIEDLNKGPARQAQARQKQKEADSSFRDGKEFGV